MSRRWKVVNVSSRPRGTSAARIKFIYITCTRCAAESRKIKTRRGPGKCHRERFRRKDLGHKHVTRTFAAALSSAAEAVQGAPLNSTIMIMIGCRSCCSARSLAPRARVCCTRTRRGPSYRSQYRRYIIHGARPCQIFSR